MSNSKNEKNETTEPSRTPDTAPARKLKFEKTPLQSLDDADLDGVAGGLRELSDTTCNSKRGGCCDRVKL